ncbi:MAG: hypothetical protein IH997_08970 [Proteobacteria bacterium]|nr:hypothetical protein [Pseudomonadota bacterium]
MTITRRHRAATLVIALALLVAGCMLVPGRFASQLDVRRDGTFAFEYRGEIVLAPLAQPSPPGEDEAAFDPSPCTDEAGDTRPCSANEIDAQRQTWEAERAERKANKDKQDAQSRKAMQGLLGGIDPGDPRAAQEFADRLARQEGWSSVVSKGHGVFEVVYAAKGRLDHNFSFPTIERLPMVVPFVTVIRRNDGTVRIEAPAFSPSSANPAIPGLGDANKDQASAALLDGTFALTTDAAVLANNTDEGPAAVPSGGQRLSWQVNARTQDAPTALLRLHD